MTDILRWLAIISWCVPLVCFASSVIRYFAGWAIPGDTHACAIWLVAAVSIGFAMRWVIFPHVALTGSDEAATWNGLYLLSAQFLTWTARLGR